MNRQLVRIGVLFSRTGSYGSVGEAMWAGSDLAVAEVNASAGFSFRFVPASVDPCGRIERYVEAARAMLAEGPVANLAEPSA